MAVSESWALVLLVSVASTSVTPLGSPVAKPSTVSSAFVTSTRHAREADCVRAGHAADSAALVSARVSLAGWFCVKAPRGGVTIAPTPLR